MDGKEIPDTRCIADVPNHTTDCGNCGRKAVRDVQQIRCGACQEKGKNVLFEACRYCGEAEQLARSMRTHDAQHHAETPIHQGPPPKTAEEWAKEMPAYLPGVIGSGAEGKVCSLSDLRKTLGVRSQLRDELLQPDKVEPLALACRKDIRLADGTVVCRLEATWLQPEG